MLKSNPALLREVLPSGDVATRLPPTGLLPIPMFADGRAPPPPESHKHFNVCTEDCFCPHVPTAEPRTKVQKVAPETEPDSESDWSDTN